MRDERWERVKRLVAAACELDAVSRDTWLNEIHDTKIRDEVESLLAAREEDSFVGEVPSSGSQRTPVRVIDSQHPNDEPAERIGPYQILREIGAGGMGCIGSA